MQNLKCAKIYRNAENDMQKALKYKYVLRMHVFEEAKSLFKLQVFSLFSFFLMFIKIWSCINIRSLMNNFIIHHLTNYFISWNAIEFVYCLLTGTWNIENIFFLVYLTSDYNYLILKNVLCINSLTNSHTF